jgi:hypothetical protein
MPRLRGAADESAGAVEGARRFPGTDHATHPPGARSTPNPSSCPPAVWRGRRRAGKCDPSRGRDRRAGDRDDRGGLRGSGDAVGAPRAPMRDGQLPDTPASNTRGRDHTRGRSRRADCVSTDFLAGAARSTTSERRRASTGHGAQTVAQEKTTGLVRRSIEAVTEGLEGQAPGLHLRPPQAHSPTAIPVVDVGPFIQHATGG